MKSFENSKPKQAISYVRFSSAAQGRDGRDSIKRQSEARDAALIKWNLVLDREFHDSGKSGFHQRHLAKGGAMAELRQLALAGKLKDKVLIIEDFDRAGRMQTTDAAPLLLDMLNHGVDLVVGPYGGEYFSKAIVNSNPFLLYRALDEMNRGFAESKRKSDMAKSKWRGRMEKIAKGEFVPLNSLPFWLGNGMGKYKFKTGMRELIKEVYCMYLAGEGSQVIANKLNLRKIPLPLRKNGKVRINANVWHPTFIQKIIKNRALLGYYHGTDYKILPPVISEADFFRANQKRQGRIHFSGRKAEHVNPYSGLCICAKCGGHLSRHSSRRNAAHRNYVYLQCRSSKRGLCSASGMPYGRFEESFSSLFGYIDNLCIASAPTDETLKSDGLRFQLSDTDERISTIKTMLLQQDLSKAVSLGAVLTELDTKRAQLKSDLAQEIIREKGTPKLDAAHFQFLKSLFAGNKLQNPDTRRQIQEALRDAIDRITIDVKSQCYKVTWKNSPDVIEVRLTPQGYKISGAGCVNLELTDFDR